jgi:hypothetical protein
MSVVVAVIIIGGMAAVCIGIITSIVTALYRRHDIRSRPPVMRSGPVYWSFTVWTLALGIFLILSPQSWFGPSWRYFAQMEPHNGKGMGVCLTVLSLMQIAALLRQARSNILSMLFFLNGFVYWTAGIILGAEGLLGHQGLMEAPFMLCIGAQAFALAASLRVYNR